MTLPSIAVPGAGYSLSFDLAFEQTAVGAESTALNPLGLMDSFRISLTDVSGQLHFDVITLDAIEGYDVAAGFGIGLSETTLLMGEIGEAPGLAGARGVGCRRGIADDFLYRARRDPDHPGSRALRGEKFAWPAPVDRARTRAVSILIKSLKTIIYEIISFSKVTVSDRIQLRVFGYIW